MLEKVSEARELWRIAPIPDIDAHGSTTFISVRL